MPRVRERYKHKQIKDEIYRVESVDTNQRTVLLTSERSPGQLQRVTFTQLKNSYERVK